MNKTLEEYNIQKLHNHLRQEYNDEYISKFISSLRNFLKDGNNNGQVIKMYIDYISTSELNNE